MLLTVTLPLLVLLVVALALELPPAMEAVAQLLALAVLLELTHLLAAAVAVAEELWLWLLLTEAEACRPLAVTELLLLLLTVGQELPEALAAPPRLGEGDTLALPLAELVTVPVAEGLWLLLPVPVLLML